MAGNKQRAATIGCEQEEPQGGWLRHPGEIPQPGVGGVGRPGAEHLAAALLANGVSQALEGGAAAF